MGMLSFLHLNQPAEEPVVLPVPESEEAQVVTDEQNENLPSDAPKGTETIVFGGKKAGAKKAASTEQAPEQVKE